VVSLEKRNSLGTIMKRFFIIKSRYVAVSESWAAVHDFGKVSRSRGHQHLLATPQALPQTDKVISMSVSDNS
jgi:hypothetical protein